MRACARRCARGVNGPLVCRRSVVSVDRHRSTDDAALLATHSGVVQRSQQVGRRKQRRRHVVRRPVRGRSSSMTAAGSALVVAAERARQMSLHRLLEVAHRRRPDDVVSGPRDRL